MRPTSDGGRFDNIVVGAGGAGCVLAGRLTEHPGVRVLVLRAGGSDDLPPSAASTRELAEFAGGTP